MTESTVHVLADAQTLAHEVAARFLAHVREAQGEDGTAHVVLTGGTIADLVHREIADQAERTDVDWGRVAFWWGDERIVASDSDDRNELQARRAMLDRLAVSDANIHPVPSSELANAREAAERYADELAQAPNLFDLVMLGVGPDGHVASLFPGHPQLEASGDTVAVLDSPKPPPERVSLTFERLNSARQTWVMASGSGKAEAVAAALQDGDVHEIPARGVRPRGELHWFLDEDASAGR